LTDGWGRELADKTPSVFCPVVKKVSYSTVPPLHVTSEMSVFFIGPGRFLFTKDTCDEAVPVTIKKNLSYGQKKKLSLNVLKNKNISFKVHFFCQKVALSFSIPFF